MYIDCICICICIIPNVCFTHISSKSHTLVHEPRRHAGTRPRLQHRLRRPRRILAVFISRTKSDPNNHTYVCISISIYLSIYLSIYIYIYMYVYIYIYVCMYIYISICIHTYIHIYIYIHTKGQMYTHDYIPVVPHKAVAEVSKIGNL